MKKEMIQRIQSVYLVIIPVIIALLYFIPLSSFHYDEDVAYLFIHGYIIEDGYTFEKVSFWYSIPLLGSFLGVLSVVVLSLYKDRKKQLLYNRVNLIINILFIASVFYITDRTITINEISKSVYHIGAYITLVPAILIYMANAGIRRDEAKVRAADRIR